MAAGGRREDSAHLDPFRDCLQDGEPICGRLQPEKNALLYGPRAEEVQSSALLPLPGLGLVAVGSRDRQPLLSRAWARCSCA